jgi:hypothetical protein
MSEDDEKLVDAEQLAELLDIPVEDVPAFIRQQCPMATESKGHDGRSVWHWEDLQGLKPA